MYITLAIIHIVHYVHNRYTYIINREEYKTTKVDNKMYKARFFGRSQVQDVVLEQLTMTSSFHGHSLPSSVSVSFVSGSFSRRYFKYL